MQTLLPGNYTTSQRFRDESLFQRTGLFNSGNIYYWEYANTRADRFQDECEINMWAGTINGKLIGPFELSRRLNGEGNLNVLQNGLFHHISLEIRQNMWLQHNAAPPHYFRLVRTSINQQFPNCWIGR